MRCAVILLCLLSASCNTGDIRNRFISSAEFDFDYGLVFGISEENQRTTEVEVLDTSSETAIMLSADSLDRIALIGIHEADIRAETLRFASKTTGMGLGNKLPSACDSEGALDADPSTQSIAMPKHQLFIGEAGQSFHLQPSEPWPELDAASLRVPVVPEQCGRAGPEFSVFHSGGIIEAETMVDGRLAGRTPRLRGLFRVNDDEIIAVLDQWVVLIDRDTGFVDTPGRAIDFGTFTVLRAIHGVWKGGVLHLVIGGVVVEDPPPNSAVIYDLEYTEANGLRLIGTATRTPAAENGVRAFAIDPESERAVFAMDPNVILVRDTLDGPIVRGAEVVTPALDTSRPLIYSTKIPEHPFALAGWGRGRVMLGSRDGRIWKEFSDGLADASIQGISTRTVGDHVELWASDTQGVLFRYRWGGATPDTRWVKVPLRLPPSANEIGCARPERDACGWVSRPNGNLAHVHALPDGPVLTFIDKCRITISVVEARCTGYRPFEVEPPFPLDNSIDELRVSEGWLTLGSRDGSIYEHRTPR